MKFLPEPVRFGLHLAGQMIVIGGFGRPEHSSSLVPKLSVVAPGLRDVTLYSLPVSQVSLDSCFTNFWLRAQGRVTLNVFSGRTLFITAVIRQFVQ